MADISNREKATAAVMTELSTDFCMTYFSFLTKQQIIGINFDFFSFIIANDSERKTRT